MSHPRQERTDPLGKIQSLSPIECGEDAAKHFLHDADYINLNHGTEITALPMECFAHLCQDPTAHIRGRFAMFFVTTKIEPKLDLMTLFAISIVLTYSESLDKCLQST
jgi:hypothetical protein